MSPERYTKRHGGQMPFVHFFLYRLVGTAAFMSLIPIAHGGFMMPGPIGWSLLILTAAVDTVVSRGLYYLALQRLDMSLQTILLTLSPVVTMLWSFALFGSVPSLREGVGGAIVLAGVLLVTGSRTARGR